MYIVPLSSQRPPLTANQRLHWASKARLVKTIRNETKIRALHAKIPSNNSRIQVQLHYRPKDKRRRDPSNLMPTQKAALDGIVDAGIIPDDTPEYVRELMPHIHPPVKDTRKRLWVQIDLLEDQ